MMNYSYEKRWILRGLIFILALNHSIQKAWTLSLQNAHVHLPVQSRQQNQWRPLARALAIPSQLHQSTSASENDDDGVSGNIVTNGASPSPPTSSNRKSLVQNLKKDIEFIKNDKGDPLEEEALSQTKQSIQDTTNELEAMSVLTPNDDDDVKRFEPLLGLYDVSYVQTAKEGDNPVGGKWTRKNKLAQQIFRTRRTFQHLLPADATGLRNTNKNTSVAEAVNVISLDAFWNLIRLTIILRGDAVPLTQKERISDKMITKLSNRAVRAFFDPPRIVLGKTGRFVNIQLGPKTSVVLDTTYIDNEVRIGMGGTSGTKFVFSRCGDEDEEAQEFRKLLERRPARKSKVLTVIGLVGGSGIWGSFVRGSKVLSGVVALSTALCAMAVSFSTGGVEDDGMDTINMENGTSEGEVI